MSHFAELDDNNVVLRVLVVEPEVIVSGVFGDPTRWVQTSYNARIRKNYAGVGYTFDAVRDAFIPPQPFPSWVLDEETCRWDSPVPYPSDGKYYEWAEDTGNWVEIILTNVAPEITEEPSA